MPKYSFIIPVYNRPEEIDELLSSLREQTLRDFEVVVVEDGSTKDCGWAVPKYENDFPLSYFFIDNSGPGSARNYGAKNARGSWFIFLDSDTILPAKYLQSVDDFLHDRVLDAFGGADRDRKDFLPIQKAISYAMTSFLTTGGIRGSHSSLEKFKPRSFNMGIKRDVYEQLGGFRSMRYGEDIDFSLRIEEADFNTAYIPEAYVYHKRRTSFISFFKQIRHSGEARILLTKLHKGSFKLVHLFPALFVFGLAASIFLSIVFPSLGWPLVYLYCLYFLSIGIHSSIKAKDVRVGLLSIIASFVQLFAYGFGFFKAATLSLIKG